MRLEIPDIRFLKFRFRFDGIKSPEGRNIGSPAHPQKPDLAKNNHAPETEDGYREVKRVLIE